MSETETEAAALEHVVNIASAERKHIVEEIFEECLGNDEDPTPFEVLAYSTVHSAVDPLSVLQLIITVCRKSSFDHNILQLLSVFIPRCPFPQDCLDHLKQRFEEFGCVESLELLNQRNFTINLASADSVEPVSVDVLQLVRKINKNKAVVKAQKDLTPMKIEDHTKKDTSDLRKKVYLQLMSSMSAEEAAHKVIGLHKKGDQSLIVEVILESCYRASTYQSIFGGVAQRLCKSPMWKTEFASQFEHIYKTQSEELSTGELRNLSGLYGNLLAKNSISWDCFKCVILDADNSTPSNRIFLQNLLVHLRTELGIAELRRNLLAIPDGASDGLFTADPHFARQYFKAIGLGAIIADPTKP